MWTDSEGHGDMLCPLFTDLPPLPECVALTVQGRPLPPPAAGDSSRPLAEVHWLSAYDRLATPCGRPTCVEEPHGLLWLEVTNLGVPVGHQIFTDHSGVRDTGSRAVQHRT